MEVQVLSSKRSSAPSSWAPEKDPYSAPAPVNVSALIPITASYFAGGTAVIIPTSDRNLDHDRDLYRDHDGGCIRDGTGVPRYGVSVLAYRHSPPALFKLEFDE